MMQPADQHAEAPNVAQPCLDRQELGLQVVETERSLAKIHLRVGFESCRVMTAGEDQPAARVRERVRWRCTGGGSRAAGRPRSRESPTQTAFRWPLTLPRPLTLAERRWPPTDTYSE